MSSSKLLRKFTPPASPTASYYDISDDDENGYSTITNTSTGRGVKLLYSKSKASFVCLVVIVGYTSEMRNQTIGGFYPMPSTLLRCRS